MAFKRTKRTFAKKRTFKRKVARKGVKRPTIKKMIRREIARNVENKTIQSFNYGKVLYSSANANFPDNVIELGPGANMSISQGASQQARIGNRIKTKKLTFKGTLVPTQYNATTNANPRPAQVKMVIFYDRTDPTALPAVSTNFFQDGSTTKGFQNDLVDMFAPYNTDRYRILTTRSFKLGAALYEGTATSATLHPDNQYFANNDFKYNGNFNIDLTKYYPQIVKFDDNNTTPTTRGLFCLFYICYADGTTVNAAYEPVGVQYVQNYVYEDA